MKQKNVPHQKPVIPKNIVNYSTRDVQFLHLFLN